MPRDEASRTAALSATSHQGRRCAPADDALAFECRTAATFDRLRIGHLAHRLALDAIARVGCILFRVEIIRRGICSSLTCSIQSTTLPLSASAMAMCLIARCKPHDVTRLNILNRAARALHTQCRISRSTSDAVDACATRCGRRAPIFIENCAVGHAGTVLLQ
jgi:hypothetical protein